jgi:predicted DNA-binding transcriptional regulator YafY
METEVSMEYYNNNMAPERNKQVERILRIIQILMNTRVGYSIKELAVRVNQEGHACGDRTIRRDIEALESLHFPIIKDGSNYKISDGAKVHLPIEMSYPELLALYVARKSLNTLANSPFNEPLQSVFNKVETNLGKGIVDLVNEMNPIFDFHLSPKWGTQVPAEVMSTIEQGCGIGKALRIEYRVPSIEPGWDYVNLKIGPEYIVFTHDGAYLYAKRLDTNEFKLYAFPRIRAAVLLEELYTAELQGEEKIHKDSFGVLTSGEVYKVQIEIAEPIASYVAERMWHSSQQVIRTEKGITLNMEVRVNDELARWVLGLGPKATVKTPTVLKELVSKLATDISKKVA